MARKRREKEEHPGELNMVAMIDVAMQLLNFFLITASPHDVLTNLDVFRPSPSAKQEESKQPPKMLRVLVAADGFSINDRYVEFRNIESIFSKLAALDANQTILIMCSGSSRHEDLIRVLDLCAKTGLKNLSVISTN